MITNALIIIRNGDKVLFVHRAATKANMPHKWALPAGRIEEGETAEITAVREAKEELDIDVTAEKIVAAVDMTDLDKRLEFVTCAMPEGATISAEPREIQDYRWMTFAEFFAEFGDEHIGHGLIWLRSRPELW